MLRYPTQQLMLPAPTGVRAIQDREELLSIMTGHGGVIQAIFLRAPMGILPVGAAITLPDQPPDAVGMVTPGGHPVHSIPTDLARVDLWAAHRVEAAPLPAEVTPAAETKF